MKPLQNTYQRLVERAGVLVECVWSVLEVELGTCEGSNQRPETRLSNETSVAEESAADNPVE